MQLTDPSSWTNEQSTISGPRKSCILVLKPIEVANLKFISALFDKMVISNLFIPLKQKQNMNPPIYNVLQKDQKAF